MDLPKLRTSGQAGPAQAAGDASLPASFPVNELAELVADLIETTGLVPADKLALVRGRVKQGGSFAQAVLDEGVASPDGIARTLASRFHLPFVELPVVGVNPDAVEQLPLHVLERVGAVPYALEGNILRVAVADPSNVQAIDELQPRDEVPDRARRRLARGDRERDPPARPLPPRPSARARSSTRTDAFLEEEKEDESDLEVDDGISDAPLVRLVNSIIFQAAEDGASDIHFEPQEDTLVVRLRIDGVLHEVQRIPKRMMPASPRA